jgi:hypothetical protein
MTLVQQQPLEPADDELPRGLERSLTAHRLGAGDLDALCLDLRGSRLDPPAEGDVPQRRERAKDVDRTDRGPP